ncbi:MAG TPA: TIGR03936 family radical SAM-associated protein [Pirellulales bacterium]|jgi:radical SAM-linked protein|nr:TIGR03936 family radical SAM-associated protein [Pirellulales bacterium]
MVRRRVRIRFRKQGDLRLIGHRDLVRAWERLFRRAGVGLRMSEGFHPKPRMSFPSALAMGVSGADEVLEVELADETDAEGLAAVLQRHAPAGLEITAAELRPPGEGPSQARRVTFELPVPPERRARLAERLIDWQTEDSHAVDRGNGRKPVDLGAFVERLELADDGVLRMHIRVTRQGTARPRELLESLGLEDLEQCGIYLTRTAVELET